MLVYVAVRGFRDGDYVDCVGVWKDRAEALDYLHTLKYNTEFTDFDDSEPYLGTEDWTIYLEEHELKG
jgi:hypothetical protein